LEWKPKKIAGQIYDLSHLHPFKFEVKPKVEDAPTYIVRVTFGFHCFIPDFIDRLTDALGIPSIGGPSR
jgi:hypothetical protein